MKKKNECFISREHSENFIRKVRSGSIDDRAVAAERPPSVCDWVILCVKMQSV
jgi:hypothetical protein